MLTFAIACIRFLFCLIWHPNRSNLIYKCHFCRFVSFKNKKIWVTKHTVSSVKAPCSIIVRSANSKQNISNFAIYTHAHKSQSASSVRQLLVLAFSLRSLFLSLLLPWRKKSTYRHIPSERNRERVKERKRIKRKKFMCLYWQMLFNVTSFTIISPFSEKHLCCAIRQNFASMDLKCLKTALHHFAT